MEGNGCRFIEEEGWTYAMYTYDEESETQDPISVVGPWGNDWYFMEQEDFASDYPTWMMEF
jgi:hypothetical protein